MNGGSFGLRTGSNGSLQQVQNGMLQCQSSVIQRKPSKTLLSGSREKERFFTFICRCLVRRKVGMLILVVFALLAFVVGLLAVNKEDASENYSSYLMRRNTNSSMVTTVAVCGEYNRRLPDMRHSSAASVIANSVSLMGHPCDNFAFPPPPPPGVRKRIGPRRVGGVGR